LTPLVLISGFLGAGKTTLLRALLPELRAAGLRPQVILNDYQNAEIDAVSLATSADPVTPIAGTCICCDSQDELMEALESASLSSSSVMLLEANGTADTVEVIEMLVADRRAARYTQPIQVTVVAVDRWQARGGANWVEEIQVRTAGYLRVTRGVEAGPERTDAVMESLRRVAPNAQVIEPGDLARTIVELQRSADALPPRRFDQAAGASDSAAADSPQGLTDSERHADTHHFSSVEIPIPGPVDERSFRALLASLPPEVVRVKGIARLASSDKQIYFERTDRPGSVALFPIRQAGQFDSVAVLIGAGIDAAALTAEFRSLV